MLLWVQTRENPSQLQNDECFHHGSDPPSGDCKCLHRRFPLWGRQLRPPQPSQLHWPDCQESNVEDPSKWLVSNFYQSLPPISSFRNLRKTKLILILFQYFFRRFSWAEELQTADCEARNRQWSLEAFWLSPAQLQYNHSIISSICRKSARRSRNSSLGVCFGDTCCSPSSSP